MARMVAPSGAPALLLPSGAPALRVCEWTARSLPYVDAYREASRLRYAAYEATRALAKIGQRVEWPEGMYPPGGAIAA